MQTAKQEVNRMLGTLTEDCSLEDIQYHLYVLQKKLNVGWQMRAREMFTRRKRLKSGWQSG